MSGARSANDEAGEPLPSTGGILMLTLIAIVAFVSIPYLLDVHFDTSRRIQPGKKDGKTCDK